MKFYLVGGSCRDMLMGIEPNDYDFVVVNPDHDYFKDWKSVGKDFPVYLDPRNDWELAYSRTERKVGLGYKGFEVNCDNVTLGDDLKRRDLTINSVAREVNWEATVEKGEPVFIGDYIDPYGGIKDIENKVLRATSESFKDDPVRSLRVARLLSRFGKEWRIDVDTWLQMDEMWYNEEYQNLVPERVFLEMEKALQTEAPSLFFETLRLYNIFPEINALYGIPQPALHHPEVETV